MCNTIFVCTWVGWQAHIFAKYFCNICSEYITPCAVMTYATSDAIWVMPLQLHTLCSRATVRSYLLTPVAHHDSGRWACRMSYHLSCERLHMVGLDDCSILQPRHLVRRRLGGTYDSISVQNLNISWLSHAQVVRPWATRWTILSPAWSERTLSIQKGSVPLQLRLIKVFECLVRQAKALCRATMALRTDHTWEKSSAQQTGWGPNLGHQRLRILYELCAWRPQSWALSWELFSKKSKLPERTGNYDSYARWLQMSKFKRLCKH
jgi:hypothetical protein